MIAGVCQKKGITYRRFRVKLADGRWGDHYVRLPDPTDPRFAEELARVNATVAERDKPARGTMSALIVEKRRLLASQQMADETRRAWAYYLDLIDEDHGKRLVSDLRKARVFKIRDDMAATPGKANVYLSKLRALLDLAVERDWIVVNPARGVPGLTGGEHEPWPAEVIEAALAKASPMLRLAIVSGLYSGQRISDLIRMQHGWHDGRIMQLRSKKTGTETAIPMDAAWLAEVRKVPRKSVTLLYDRTGKPFTRTERLQASLRRLMRDLGYTDNEGQSLYSFHGLGKNACCYLTELGLSDTEISALVGKTPQTVRHYAKRSRVYMIAVGAAEKLAVGRVRKLRGS